MAVPRFTIQVAFRLNATGNPFLRELQKTYPPVLFSLVFLDLPIEYKARYEKILETMASSQHPVTASLLGPVYKSIPTSTNTPHQVLFGVSSPELSDLRTNLKNKGFAEYLSYTPGLGSMVDSSIPLVSGLSARRAVKVASHVEDVVKRQEDGLGTIRIEGFWMRIKKVRREKAGGHGLTWKMFPFGACKSEPIP
jgi:hypothetical protein